MSKFAKIHRRSIDDAADFWAEAAEGIDWETRWDRVLDDSNPPIYRWFHGGRLNTCYNAVDRHAENGRGDQAAMLCMAVKDAGATQVALVVVTSAKSHRQNYQIARRVARNDRYRLAVVRAARHRDRATRVWSQALSVSGKYRDVPYHAANYLGTA